MADEEKTTQVEESRAAETAPQETEPAEQSEAKPQEATVEQVEPTTTNQAPVTSRERPSSYYANQRILKSLKEQVSAQNKQMTEMAEMLKGIKPKEPEVPEAKFSTDEFFADPNKILSTREQALKREIDELKKQVGQFQEFTTKAEQADFQRKSQDALELLYPKTSEDDLPSATQRAEASPERTDRIMAVLDQYGLHDKLDTDPSKTVPLILKLMEEPKQVKTDPTVIPKKAMGGASRGGASQGKPTSLKEQKRLEVKRLMEEAGNDNDLRLNDEHRTKRASALRELEQLEKE